MSVEAGTLICIVRLHSAGSAAQMASLARGVEVRYADVEAVACLQQQAVVCCVEQAVACCVEQAVLPAACSLLLAAHKLACHIYVDMDMDMDVVF